MNDSILFSSTGKLWAHKRKTIAATFYKDKLYKMAEKIKGCVLERISEWSEKYEKLQKPMNIVDEIL
jgi:hypothetical protein